MKCFFGKIKIIGEIFEFLGHERLWWLAPPIIILLLFGLLFVLSHGTVLAPFLYPLF
ncbi:hypothetical protein HY948_04740 [Candidatus Gottesmanbacteria bacterium]|nr:hypothetical protein [Candidatus Gottesmanbacteria bacterium]